MPTLVRYEAEFGDPEGHEPRIRDQGFQIRASVRDSKNRVRSTTGSEPPIMPPTTIDSRSIIVDGHRFAIMGAGIEYAGLDPWTRRKALGSLSALGFNTVLASCPWHLHERLPGDIDFEGRLDLRGFLEDAWDHDLRVILRIGPTIGTPFDGGGLPTWLGDRPEVETRSGSPSFLELVSGWYASLAEQIVDLQSDRDGGGPLLAVQIEHDWRCGSVDVADKYLNELLRYARECGLSIPILTANGFWSPVEGTTETWIGWDDLFMNVRQMSMIQPESPRICMVDRSSEASAFHRPGQATSPVDAGSVVDRLVQVVAAGGQPILSHAVDVRLPSGSCGRDEHGPISPSPFTSPVVDARGEPTELGFAVGRFARFVRDFSTTVADLDPDDRPITRDMNDTVGGSIMISRRGGMGDLVFGFKRGEDREINLVDSEGRRVPMDLGDHPVVWRAADADLDGHGRLDVASATPLAFIEGRLLVFSAPAGMKVEMSIDGRPLEIVVPRSPRAGGTINLKPAIESIGGFTIAVIEDEWSGHLFEQVGVDGVEAIVIGASRINPDGTMVAVDPLRPVRIDLDGKVSHPRVVDEQGIRTRRNRGWSTWTEPDPRDPSHPRSIPMDGGFGLSAIGAGLDHAWFTARMDLPDAKARELRLLGGLHDSQAWLDGEVIGRLDAGGFKLKTTKGEHDLALFAAHQPRHVAGVRAPADGDRPGPLVATKPMTGVKESHVDIAPMDPFEVASFVPGAAEGELTSDRGVEFVFTHRRRSTVILEIESGTVGVLILNGSVQGVFGPDGARIPMSASTTDEFKSGVNRIVLVPLEHMAEAGREPAAKILEITEVLVPEDGWRVRRFETAPDTRIGSWNGAPARHAEGPRWVRTTVPVPASIRDETMNAVIRLEGLTRGRIRANGIDLGGYALRVPGERMARNIEVPEVTIPHSILAERDEVELEIFDEGGADPSKVVVRI